MPDADPTRAPSPREHFPPTRWSVVLAACDEHDPGRAAVALDELCRSYWFPLYVYIRRSGYSPENAEDLAQADRGRGTLRSFLLTTLKHFLSDEWSKTRAQKRGAGAVVISIDGA